MTVDSDGKVDNLNADKLDGKDSSAFAVTSDGKRGSNVSIEGCGFGEVLSYPLTLTRPSQVFATASAGYIHSTPGPDTASIGVQLLDSSNAVVANSSRLLETQPTGNLSLTLGEVLLGDGNVAYNAPAGNYTLRILATNRGTCTGFGDYQVPRLTHIVLPAGQ